VRLERVDPTRHKGALRRGQEAFGRTAVGRWYGVHIAAPLDARLLRHTGGRVRLAGSLPTALLTTTGARSGEPRRAPVVYFHDGDDVVLVASSFGRDTNPAWYHNLVAHPAVSLNDEPFTATEVVDESEYERLFALASMVFSGYADYRARTDTVGRHIPVLRLTPR
jgi:deazaflavin-dependent oxidoreductase (nitroreductase family)